MYTVYKNLFRRGELNMKKLSVFIAALLLASLLLTSVAGADTYIFIYGGKWYSSDSTGRKTPLQDIPPKYNDYLVRYDFPVAVIQDVSYLCDMYYGTPVGLLGLSSDKGINLRTAPNLGDGYRGVQLHAGTTVYVYFSFIDSTNREWYYCTTAAGQTGFCRSNFLKLYSFSLY